jgi:hypothetical protein
MGDTRYNFLDDPCLPCTITNQLGLCLFKLYDRNVAFNSYSSPKVFNAPVFKTGRPRKDPGYFSGAFKKSMGKSVRRYRSEFQEMSHN